VRDRVVVVTIAAVLVGSARISVLFLLFHVFVSKKGWSQKVTTKIKKTHFYDRS
jgi:hypothetical protein